MRRSMVQRAGGTLSYLLNITFATGLVLQVSALVYQQEHRIAAQLLSGRAQAVFASGQAAVVFLLDVLGILLLLPPAMIRADGIVGKQRAAVDTELWLALPLSGQQRVVARLGQATFFLTLLGVFLLSHLLAPSLAFAPSLPSFVLLFGLLSGAALLLILGGGIGAYALVRRYVPLHRQGQLVAWAGISLLPLGYAYYLVARGTGGQLALRMGAALTGSPVAGLLLSFHERDLLHGLYHTGVLLLAALLLSLTGWQVVRLAGREAVDDLSPLISARRYRGGRFSQRKLTHLHKDLLVALRDPTHRGVLISSMLVVLLPLSVNLIVGGGFVLPMRAQVGQNLMNTVLAVACFAVGLSVLMAAGQWMPLESKALEWLRTSGVDPLDLILRKGRSASLQAVLLCVPVCVFLPQRMHGVRAAYEGILVLFAIGMAWFMVGDTAARFPQSRRDTRPVQLRSLYAGYLVVLSASVVLPISLSASATALCLLCLGAWQRIEAGVQALINLDDTPTTQRPVRCGDAFIVAAVAVASEWLLLRVFMRVLRPLLGDAGFPVSGDAVPPLLLSAMASAAPALILGLRAASYLRNRVPPLLRAKRPGVSGHLFGLLCGLISVIVALAYIKLLPGRWPGLVPPPGAFAAPLGYRLCAALIVAGLVPPLEELFYRGWILRGLDLYLGSDRKSWAGLLISALIYALLHPGLPYLPTFVLGLCTGLAFRRTGALGPAVLAHVAYNAIPAFILLLGRVP